jgi:hypothetical protein
MGCVHHSLTLVAQYTTANTEILFKAEAQCRLTVRWPGTTGVVAASFRSIG